MNPKTEADLLFEKYLQENEYRDFLYEQPLPESSKVPDYQLPWLLKPLLFEVKGFDTDAPTGSGYFDPYAPLRRKITRAAEKFKQLKSYSCSLVLHHSGPGLVFLDSQFVFAAMLGDIGIEIPFDSARGTLHDEEAQNVFMRGGKMIEYARGGRFARPVNPRINAIIVVEHYPLGQRRFDQYYDDLQARQGRRLTSEECWQEVKSARGTDRDVSLRMLRVVVHENPYAAIPLPQELFIGACDERYGTNDQGMIVKRYAGATVSQFDWSPHLSGPW